MTSAAVNSVWRERLEIWIKNFGDKDFNRVINGYKGQIGRLKKQLKTARKSGHEFNATIKNSRIQMTKWLGVGLSLMFISMGIASAFGRMMQPALEVIGIFDIWRALMISILLPILLPFVSMLIDFFNFLSKHPALKKFIGWLIVIGFLFFTILQWVAQFAILFGLLAFVEGAIAAVASVIGIAAAIAGLVILLIDLFRDWGNWVEFILKILAMIAAVLITVFLLPVELSLLGIALVSIAISGLFFLIINNFGAIISWLKENWAVLLVRLLLAPFQPMLMTLKWIIKILDKIKGTNIMSGKFGRLLDIAAFGEGGIVTKPTLALIGERGPEAVVPLTGAGAGGVGGGITVNVNINGTFGDSNGPNRLASLIQVALRDELRRLGVR